MIIPTRDRAPALARTLAALRAQSGAAEDFEIVVANNGSGDETRGVIAEARGDGGIPVTDVDQPSGGPAAARNAAAEAATGEVLLLLGDDTEPSGSDLLEHHASLHRLHPEDTFACLGRIEWSPRTPVSHFMRWLDRGGPQFHYWELEAGPVSAESYFYSSHLSLKRSLFLDVGGFDRRFPFAAVEDTDLGARLADRGVCLEYHPELLVWHDHPTTLEQSLDRTVRVGRSAALYNAIRPGRPHRHVQPPGSLKGPIARAASPLATTLARLPGPAPVRERIWSLAHRCRYAVGYRHGPPEPR